MTGGARLCDTYPHALDMQERRISGATGMVTDPNAPADGGDDREDAKPRGADRKEAPSSTVAVRYGRMNHLGEFTYPPNVIFACGTKVVVRTPRGTEIGAPIALSCPGVTNPLDREQTRQYVHGSGPEYCQPRSGRILREATRDDLHENEHLRAGTVEKREFCQATANRLAIPLKIVECEHLLGGERIVFYFLAEGRVDFRSLVKEMAVEYQTRIEMRQVGVRDEARLLADYETCGRECCCRMFLKTLRPVSMKMAKMQKATLDPSKVSGRCGRLKCCLRYEHVAYEELDHRLPRIGARVGTASGDGVVIGRQILTQLLQVQVGDGAPFAMALEDVFEAGGKNTEDQQCKPPASAPPAKPSKRERRPSGETAAADGDRGAQAEAKGAGDQSADTEPASAKPTRRRKRGRRKRGTNGPQRSPGNEPPPKAD